MELVKYDAACKALAAAGRVDEVKSIRDKAIALKEYGRQAKNRQLEKDAARIRFRAERRLGEMLAAGPKNKGAASGGKKDSPRGSFLELRDSAPTLAEIGIDKKLSSRARKLAAIAPKKFESMLAEWEDRINEENDRITSNLIREGERAKNKKKKAKELPKGLFDLIYADPPWRYEHVKTESRAIENQYPTMSLEEIKNLRVPAGDDCVLFLWATSPKLAEAMEVITAWGFVYRTCAVWIKDKIGMGYYFRQQHELLLVATRGEPGAPPPNVRVKSIIEAPRDKHSAKPKEVYSLLEKMYPKAKKIELFARGKLKGWSSWGNE